MGWFRWRRVINLRNIRQLNEMIEPPLTMTKNEVKIQRGGNSSPTMHQNTCETTSADTANDY